MYKKVSKLLAIIILVLLFFVTPRVSASEKKEDVSKYFEQTKLIASYYKNSVDKVEFYNSTNNPKFNKNALTNFKIGSTVDIDINFLLKEKDNGESYKPGDWFTVPLDSTIIDYPEMKIHQFIKVDGVKIIEFYIKKINNLPVVYFEFTNNMIPDKYDFFENGKINIFGKVEKKAEGIQTITVGEETITLSFEDNEVKDENKTTGTNEKIGYKLLKTSVNSDFDKRVLSSSITSDEIRYEFNINQNLVSKYYVNNNTNINRKNLVLVDQLGDGLIFKDDTFNLEINMTMPCVAYKYNGDELVLKNNRPIITGTNKKTFIFKLKQEFIREYQKKESNIEFLEKITNTPHSYGITKDGKEFYINLGNVGDGGNILSEFNTNESLRKFLDKKIGTSMDTSKNLKNYVLDDMIKLYGESSNNAFSAISMRLRATAEKTSYENNDYRNDASLSYRDEEEVILKDTVFSKNYKTTASISAGAYNSITISKTDANNENIKLEGVTFNLYKEGSDKVLSSSKTNDKGIIVFDHLEAGVKYKVKEIIAKLGYDVESYKATLSEGYEFDESGFIQIDDKPGRQGVVLTVTNDLLTHAVSLTKKDVNGNLLANTKFELFIKNDDKWTSVGSKTTNRDGEILFDGLLEGTYKFEEVTATPGYNRDSFKLYNGDKKITTFTISNSENVSKNIELMATNDILKHSVILTKYGINSSKVNKVLSNVKFGLFIKDNDNWTLVNSAITDESGKLKFIDLMPGTYRIDEVKSLTGYLTNSFKLYNKADVNFDETGLLESVNLEKEITEFTINSDLTEETVFEFIGTNLEIPTSINKEPMLKVNNNYDLPQTGDNFNKTKWFILATLSGVILLISKHKKING